jgi:uncharacterized protein YacL
MLKRAVQISFWIIGGILGVFFIPMLTDRLEIDFLANPYISGTVGAVVGAALFYALTFWAIDHVVGVIKYVEERLVKAPVTDILFGSLGLIFGLIVAYFLSIPMRNFSFEFISTVVPFFITVLCGYLGFQVGFKKRHELANILTVQRGAKKKATEEEVEPVQQSWKILDTSVIIDGRIADICQTGFLEGTIVIPQFVLGELQHIADSSDSLKRTRGRRGLDILNRIQKELPIKVEIYDGDFEEIQEVDSKLVKLAKLTNGVVVTNDFNLNKVCELQRVAVLNINDLANAIKPVVLPGEEMRVLVVKDGKEQKQGVAYLDDGTMIVVEDGKEYIGKEIDVLVTSVLQTSAGRMIFAKFKALEKVL